MTPVSPVTSRIAPATPARRIAATSAAPAEAATGRAVIALEPVVRSDAMPPLSRRPRADFLAHLIATSERMPQTRDKRRAAPEVAIQAYAKVRQIVQPQGAAAIERVA